MLTKYNRIERRQLNREFVNILRTMKRSREQYKIDAEKGDETSIRFLAAMDELEKHPNPSFDHKLAFLKVAAPGAFVDEANPAPVAAADQA
jgi:hypothetical protein